jgi:hypothetical protein
VGDGAVVVGARAQLLSSTGTNTSSTYDMGPETAQQGPDGGNGVVIHTAPMYSVPVKTPKQRPDENNVYDMQVPGMKSKRAGAAAAGAPTPSSTAAAGAPKLCTRPSPSGDTCKNAALPGGGWLFCKGHTCPECDAGKSSSDVGCPAHNTAAPAGSNSSTIVYAVPADDGPDDAGADGGGATNNGVYYDADAVPGEATVPANTGVYYDADAVPAEGGGGNHAVAAAAASAVYTDNGEYYDASNLMPPRDDFDS